MPRLVLPILFAAFFAGHGSADELVMPSDLDRFFYLVSINFREPEVCRRIDPAATGRVSALARQGYRVQTLQSECYLELATLLRSAPLCDYVKPVRADGLDGSRIDKAYCLSQLHSAGILASPDPSFMPAFVRVLQTLGYDDGRVAQFIHTRSRYDNPAQSTYEKLSADGEFLRCVRAAPSYARPGSESQFRPARPAEFLYQMVAIDNNDPGLCAKISAHATFDRPRGRTALLRSQCYVAIAYNQRNAALCDQLPRTGTSRFVNASFDSRESCRETVAIYRRPGFNDGGLHNGPSFFSDAADFGRALQEIGFSDPNAASAPKPAADDYWDFFSHLANWSGAQDRAEFLQRVKRLR
jgi:hypothetical protein